MIENNTESVAKNRSSSWITLNIGGQIFATTRETILNREPDSMLARMIAEHNGVSWDNQTDDKGSILIDRSPEYFMPILNYLRHGKIILDKNINPEGVLEEANFFGIESMIKPLQLMAREWGSSGVVLSVPLSRLDVIRMIMGTISLNKLRCQGLDFSGSDLSCLDLSGINFDMCHMRYTNLSRANLTKCHFNRADCTGAIFDKAIMNAVHMKCALLDNASMIGVFMEGLNKDSDNVNDDNAIANLETNLEGASLKNANLENSQLPKANFRVTCLRDAKLTHCNLRLAILAGADLENADLSGSDLQDTNLRGANIINCIFGDLRTPLHMTQTMNTLRG